MDQAYQIYTEHKQKLKKDPQNRSERDRSYGEIHYWFKNYI